MGMLFGNSPADSYFLALRIDKGDLHSGVIHLHFFSAHLFAVFAGFGPSFFPTPVILTVLRIIDPEYSGSEYMIW